MMSSVVASHQGQTKGVLGEPGKEQPGEVSFAGTRLLTLAEEGEGKYVVTDIALKFIKVNVQNMWIYVGWNILQVASLFFFMFLTQNFSHLNYSAVTTKH